MRAQISVLLLPLASCAVEPAAPTFSTLMSGETSTVSIAPLMEEDCRDFEAPIIVGGMEQMARGRACRQPDGTWQIVPRDPGEAFPSIVERQTIVYQTWPSYYGPWWGGPFGFGGFIGLHEHHHHHHHR
ncbi:MAG: hypothetical protein IRZ04_13500 [Rhodospirillales bacterium]|nr:hypothetical protein [Rhodospirillales bacterium]